jgi:hypothetical protein
LPASAGPASRPTPARPRRPSWLQKLEVQDREAAEQARSLIRDLEALGIEDAEGTVRRDILGGQPEVAGRLLAEALRRAIAAQLNPSQIVAASQAAGRGATVDPLVVATQAIARALDVALGVIVNSDRLAGAPLVERGSRRRVRIQPPDLR